METILVCKPSGKNAATAVLLFIAGVIGMVVAVYYTWNGTPRWGTFLFFCVMAFISFFASRFEFFGEEHLGIDGKDFVIHYVKNFPLKKDKRIPLAEISEVRFNQKSKAQEIDEMLMELRGRMVNEDSICLITKSGEVYIFGKDLSEKQVNDFCKVLRKRINAEIAIAQENED